MKVGDQVYEEGRSYVLYTVVDFLGDSALLENGRGERMWMRKDVLRVW